MTLPGAHQQGLALRSFPKILCQKSVPSANEPGDMPSDHARREIFLDHLSGCESTLRAFIAGALAAAHERADFFQEVVLILWRRFDDYDAARPFLPWAMGVAVRRMKEEYRRVQRRPGLLPAEQLERLANALTAAEERHSSAEEETALAACLAALPESSARLVQRRYYERAGIETLSAETGQSTAAIYQTLSRLRRALADCIRRRLRSEDGIQLRAGSPSHLPAAHER
jgi:RNA polymerase sigma-70 factor (ECF subfamily)